jgi:hypothetical protein
MAETVNSNHTLLKDWLSQNFNEEKVRIQLGLLGYDAEAAEEHIKYFRKLKNAKRQHLAFICIGAGGLIGFISCISSLFSYSAETSYWCLFGLTSVAVVFVFAGLYYLLEH